ncbi:MAG TPA: alpha/beta hydrolase [Gemmatimonadaceae bacterium]|nr:alpha/beta hydrolase [Gemmatimonadaceae bacterium]
MPPHVLFSDDRITIAKPSPRTGVPVAIRRARRRSRLDWIRLAFAIALFVVALLTALPAPVYAAWLTGLVAGEAGHWLAPVALLTLLPGWRASVPGRLSLLLGVTSGVLFITPVVQAMRISPEIVAGLTRVWGPPEFVAFSGDEPREKPVQLLDLYAGVPIGDSRMRTMVYASDADGDRRLDLYLPLDSSRPAPLLIMVHGGSWRAGDRTELPKLARYFSARGIAVASPDYRLAPAHKFPAARDDVLLAASFIQDNALELSVDPSRVVYLGRSAGAQIAVSAAAASEDDPRVRGAVSLYGPLDLRWGYANPGNPNVVDGRAVLRDYLGGTPAEVSGAYDAASPIASVNRRTKPVLLIHGERDDIVSPIHADRFVARMEWAARPALLVRLPWATHGCDAILRGPCGQITLYSVERFLAAVMR